MGKILAALDAATAAFWVLLAIAAVIAIWYLYKWLKGLYESFTSSGGAIEEQITNMFTPHNDDGTVDPVDVAPKGTDPIDWLFMDHSVSSAI